MGTLTPARREESLQNPSHPELVEGPLQNRKRFFGYASE